MNRFIPYYGDISVEWTGIKDSRTGKSYPRPEYNNVEIASVARWLNEREAGYPLSAATATERFNKTYDENARRRGQYT